jgi:cell division control protein 24
MATSTVSGFLPRRKQSISNGFGAEGHQLNLPPSMMPPTASPGPGTPSSYNGSSYPFHGDSSRASTSTTASSATLVNGHAPHSHHPAHMMYNASGSSTPANNSSISLVSGSTLANSSNGMGGASNNSPAAASSSADGGIGASLIPGAPLAANNMSNKPANAGSSLYQSCLNLRDRLWRVDGFGPAYLTGSDADAGVGESSPTVDSSNTSAPSSPKSKAVNAKDPVTQLWHCFRRGSPLCVLLNKLGPKTELPTTVPPATGGKVEGVGAVNKPNDCKKLVAKFIMALKTELGFQTEEIFTISQLYLNDTNGFVRVVRTISKVLDVFEERGLLVPSQKPDLEHELEDDAKPGDDRARVVRELLDTERKYVMDLETLQGFAKALAQNAILPPDTIHNLFGNLNTMVDVQRRFLICVEENARRPVDDQHFGHVFRTMVS